MTQRIAAADATILVVDDDPEVCTTLCRVLAADNYEAHAAADATGALRKLRETAFDAVVCDYDMPGMDGLALLQRVRIQRPGMLRILLTGNADMSVAVRALNEGAVDRFVLKPWRSFDLCGMLRMTLHGRQARSAIGGAR